MEPLFTTQTVFGFDEYLAYAMVIWRRQIVVTVVLIMLVAAAAAVAASLFRLYAAAIVLLLCGTAYSVYRVLLIRTTVKKELRARPEPDGAVCTFSFYEDRVVSQGNGEENVWLYSKLERIIETKARFFIVVDITDKVLSLIVNKAECSPELLEHISGLRSDIRKRRSLAAKMQSD